MTWARGNRSRTEAITSSRMRPATAPPPGTASATPAQRQPGKWLLASLGARRGGAGLRTQAEVAEELGRRLRHVLHSRAESLCVVGRRSTHAGNFADVLQRRRVHVLVGHSLGVRRAKRL